MTGQHSEPSPSPIEVTSGKPGKMMLVKVVAFVAVIVLVEVVAASLLIPSAAETEHLANELAAASHGKAAAAETNKHDDHGSGEHNVREVKLGSYNITRYNPATNMTRAIDFELFGTVLAEDLTEFNHLFEHSQARVREQVIITLHGAESTDLTDAGLGLLKRQILEKTNRALGQPMIREVLFSRFSFVER